MARDVTKSEDEIPSIEHREVTIIAADPIDGDVFDVEHDAVGSEWSGQKAFVNEFGEPQVVIGNLLLSGELAVGGFEIEPGLFTFGHISTDDLDGGAAVRTLDRSSGAFDDGVSTPVGDSARDRGGASFVFD